MDRNRSGNFNGNSRGERSEFTLGDELKRGGGFDFVIILDFFFELEFGGDDALLFIPFGFQGISRVVKGVFADAAVGVSP